MLALLIPLLCCAYMVALEFIPESIEILAAMKALPILAMILLVNEIQGPSKQSIYPQYIEYGLVFSAIGDICLELEPWNEDLFICGLASFLIAHWLYVVAFVEDFHSRNVFAAIVSLIYAGAFVRLLWSHIEEDFLKGAVCFYAFSIGVMLWCSCRRLGSLHSSSHSQ